MGAGKGEGKGADGEFPFGRFEEWGGEGLEGCWEGVGWVGRRGVDVLFVMLTLLVVVSFLSDGRLVWFCVVFALEPYAVDVSCPFPPQGLLSAF